MIHMPHASDSPTWFGMLGVVAPIIVGLFVWGTQVESRSAVVEQGQKVLLAEIKRLETRVDTLAVEIGKVKEQR